jgi:enoyl-CoA hydratase
MNFKNLLLRIENKIAIVTINRPDKLNALNSATLDELKAVFMQLEKDDHVNVIVLTGSGEKAFVAGADISVLNKCNEDTGEEFAKKGQEIFGKIENCKKPVIAAVNGFALGGGCELALSCHIRIASENAKFGQPEVNLGIIPGYGGTQRLARLINTGRAAEYILTGDMITAEEALRIGLINKITNQAQLLEEAVNLADKISSKGQIAVRAALRSVVSINNITQKEGLVLEAQLFGSCCGTKDFEEGTSAFLEKRKPVFINK